MKCPYCSSDTDYSNLGNHWRQSCGYPEPREYEKEVFDGLVMGDGCLKHTHIASDRQGNQSIEVTSISETFVNHLYSDFEPFFTEPKVKCTAEESAKNAIDSEVISSPEGASFRTQYRVVSRAIPYFNRYDSWKDGGDKRWSDDITFTSNRLKYLYAADGGLSWNKQSKSARAQITTSNETTQLPRLKSLLDDIDVESTIFDDRIIMTPKTTDNFLSYLGDPVPGFEYKWENSDLGRYEDLYQNLYYREGHTYTV